MQATPSIYGCAQAVFLDDESSAEPCCPIEEKLRTNFKLTHTFKLNNEVRNQKEDSSIFNRTHQPQLA